MRKNLKTSHKEIHKFFVKLKCEIDAASLEGRHSKITRSKARLAAVNLMAAGLPDLALSFDKLAKRGLQERT